MIKTILKSISFFFILKIISSLLLIIFNFGLLNVNAEEVVDSVMVEFKLISRPEQNGKPMCVSIDNNLYPLDEIKSPAWSSNIEVKSIDIRTNNVLKYFYCTCDSLVKEDIVRNMNVTQGMEYKTNFEFFNRPNSESVEFLPEIWENPYIPKNSDIFDIDYIGTFYLTAQNVELLNQMNKLPHTDVKVPFKGLYIGNDEIYKIEEDGWLLSITGNYSKMFTKQSFKIAYKGKDKTDFTPTKLKLKGFPNDATMLREPISIELLNKVGIPTYRGSFARLYINNEYYGLYYFEDTMKKTYIRDLFHSRGKNPEIGPLFQAIPNKNAYNASLNYIDDQALSYPNWNLTWDCKINGTAFGSKDESFTKLIDLMKKINETDFSSIKEMDDTHSVYEVFELDIFIRVLAMDYLLGRFHGYWRNPSNYLIYFHPALKRYVIYPTDFTSSLGYKYVENDYTYKTNYSEWRLADNPDDPLINIVMNYPFFNTLFKLTLKLIVENLFTPYYLFPFVDSLKNLIKYDLEMERNLKPYHSKTSIIEEIDIQQTKVEDINKDANGFPTNSTIDTTIIVKKNTTITLIEPNWTIEKSLTAIDESVSDIGYGIKEWISKRSEFVKDLLQNETLVTAGYLVTRPSDPSNLYSDSIFDYFETIFPSGKYKKLIFFLISLFIIIVIVFYIHLKLKKPTEMEGDEHDIRKYNDSFFHRLKTRFTFTNEDGIFSNLCKRVQGVFKKTHTKIKNGVYKKSHNID